MLAVLEHAFVRFVPGPHLVHEKHADRPVNCWYLALAQCVHAAFVCCPWFWYQPLGQSAHTMLRSRLHADCIRFPCAHLVQRWQWVLPVWA